MSTARVPTADVAVIGAGNVGIAVAHYLARQHGVRDVVLIDARDPMSLTSARHTDATLMAKLTALTSRGVL